MSSIINILIFLLTAYLVSSLEIIKYIYSIVGVIDAGRREIYDGQDFSLRHEEYGFLLMDLKDFCSKAQLHYP